jgi:hypothetical protein
MMILQLVHILVDLSKVAQLPISCIFQPWGKNLVWEYWRTCSFCPWIVTLCGYGQCCWCSRDTCIFRVDVCRLVSFHTCVYICKQFCFENNIRRGRQSGDWFIIWASMDSALGKLCRGPFKGPGVYENPISNWCSQVVTHSSAHQA